MHGHAVSLCIGQVCTEFMDPIVAFLACSDGYLEWTFSACAHPCAVLVNQSHRFSLARAATHPVLLCLKCIHLHNHYLPAIEG
jgi:hypothetical protein